MKTHYFTGHIRNTSSGAHLVFACGLSSSTRNPAKLCSALITKVTCPQCKAKINAQLTNKEKSND